MRMMLGLAALALATAATPQAAPAQPYYGIPPGSYQRDCTDIRVEGQFLIARCRGPGGWGQSSINIASCASDIGVGPDGGLICIGPNARGAPYAPQAAPGYYPDRAPRYAPGPGYYPDRSPRYAPRPGYGRYRGDVGVTLYGGRNWRGEPLWIDGDVANLAEWGLNDRVRSIELQRGSGPWLVCSDAGFRGRCETIDRSVADTRALGMGDSISSLRPLY
jgi:hypothetical protein